MPRTKAVKKRRFTSDNANSTSSGNPEKNKDINVQIDELKEDIQQTIKDLNHSHTNHIKNLQQMYSLMHLDLNTRKLADKKINEIRAMDAADSSDKENVHSGINPQFSKPKTQRSERKRSQSCNTRTTHKTLKGSRSASCDRNNLDSASKFKTPNNRHHPSIPVVTPKVNPNIPLSVLRRPRQGEFAISMSGSPLMVSSVTYDEVASVSVPLPDGRILSILPTEGISSANLHLDEATRKQLIKLRSNLSKCLSQS